MGIIFHTLTESCSIIVATESSKLMFCLQCEILVSLLITYLVYSENYLACSLITTTGSGECNNLGLGSFMDHKFLYLATVVYLIIAIMSTHNGAISLSTHCLLLVEMCYLLAELSETKVVLSCVHPASVHNDSTKYNANFAKHT